MTSKTTNDGVDDTEVVDYTYNLQGRLETVTTAGALTDYDADSLDDDRPIQVVSYIYDPSGIRTGADSIAYNVTDYGQSGVENWIKQSSSTTDYLIDPANHTGYAQVLEETAYEDDGQSGWAPVNRIQYTIGDDVLAQTTSTTSDGGVNWSAGDTKYLLYDGHGSTRQLAGENQAIQQSYNYDAYGTLLQDSTAESNPGITPQQDTKLLYAGEQFDASSQMYCNRARYYNPLNGIFNRTDPYAGNTHDPQSLHKYAYVHNNPVNSIDPTGMFTSMTELEVSVGIMTTLEMQMSVCATLLTMTYAQERLSFAGLARQHGAKILTEKYLYENEFNDGYRYFIHGTSWMRWTAPNLFGNFDKNDFGKGFYTFPLYDEYEHHKWESVLCATNYAYQRSKGGLNGDPMLVVVRFKEETYRRLTKLKLLNEEKWEEVVNGNSGINRFGYMGFDEIIGFHSDPNRRSEISEIHPFQHKFEPSGILKGMEYYAFVPLPYKATRMD